MSGIPISPKHGVNPTMLVCFWCGKPKGIALMGNQKGDIKAPPYVVGDYDPCPNCEDIFNKGICLIGTVKEPILEGMPPIGETNEGEPVYPDTTYCVVQEDCIHQMYSNRPEMLQNVLQSRTLLVPSQLIQRVIKSSQEEDPEDESNQSGASDSDPRECDEAH